MQFNSNQPDENIIHEYVQYSNVTTLIGMLGFIDKSDVPHVYHHLRKGCILQLTPITGENNRQLMFGVNYGSYRIGILGSAMARKIQQLEMSGKVYRITISNIIREKYLPPSAIEVELACETDCAGRAA